MNRIKIEKLEFAIGVSQTKWLTKEEQNRFISYVELERNEFKRLRNLDIIDLMLYTRFRVHEVTSLEVNAYMSKKEIFKSSSVKGKITSMLWYCLFKYIQGMY